MNRKYITRIIAPLAATLFILTGCVEELSTPVVFDVVLNSTTFENRLRAPVAIIRNGEVIDTLQAGSKRSYALGRRGPVRHEWQLIAPVDNLGRKWSEEPRVALGIQYQIDQEYEINNDGPEQTIFTPRIVNLLTQNSVQLIVNEDEDDERITQYVYEPNSVSSLTNAPYFYWHSSSNVVLDVINSSRVYRFRRSDTGDRELKLNDSFFGSDEDLRGSGVTEKLVVED
jgi:hypothetical protein